MNKLKQEFRTLLLVACIYLKIFYSRGGDAEAGAPHGELASHGVAQASDPRRINVLQVDASS
ncbi:MAG: hypothetical protein A3E83_06470 [Gammaproteobacteria bacterium RIFCSPHIGHO2_12_FULL_41_20]|nr:MAG: hypothetical protein A3E83_06470 [Gammaproteobacteria bacterium RIFCSPHIGHO2_12_FULL_41_20]